MPIMPTGGSGQVTMKGYAMRAAVRLAGMFPSLMWWRCQVKAIVLAIVVTAGCATVPPADRESAEYERNDARLRAVERFEAFEQACRASGGTVYVVDRSWGMSSPTLSDMRAASCAASLR
jgi:hypothetical protein